MGETVFAMDQVDAAIEHVIDNGACNNGSTIYYSLVFAAAGLAAPQELHQRGDSRTASTFMEASHHRCLAQGLPALDALVVHVAGARKGQPGSGYFRINNLPDPFAERTPLERAVDAIRHWEKQRRECETWAPDDVEVKFDEPRRCRRWTCVKQRQQWRSAATSSHAAKRASHDASAVAGHELLRPFRMVGEHGGEQLYRPWFTQKCSSNCAQRTSTASNSRSTALNGPVATRRGR